VAEVLSSLPEVMIEDRVFTRAILGHNPFLGFSYYSRARAAEYEQRFSDPARIEEIISAALETGVRGMMMSFDHPRHELILSALEGACAASGVRIPTIAILSPGFERHAEELRKANAQVGLLHGQVTDTLFQRGSRDFAPAFAEHLARMRELGLVPGASTHNGGETVPAMAGYDVAVVNTPVNKLGWRMCPCPEEALAALASTEKSVIAMKPLAMGRIAPEEGMGYVLARPEVDLTVVGAASPQEAKETFAVARGAMRVPQRRQASRC
jgi:hypothetical protein